MRPLIKSELMTLATSAYQEALNDFYITDRSMMEGSSEHVVDCFIDRQVNAQTCCGKLEDELLREAVKSLVLSRIIMRSKEDRLKEVFWPVLTGLIASGDFTQAIELARSLPECTTRMKAIAFIEKAKI